MSESHHDKQHQGQVKQEILDLFARYGSGQYEPTAAECQIIDAGLDEILFGGRNGALPSHVRPTTSGELDRDLKLAEEVVEADFRAGIKGLCHPNLEWHKAVQLAGAVLRSRPSATALSDLPSPYRKLLAVEDRDANHRECQRQDAMFAHQLANMGGLLNEALEIIDSVGPSALGDRIRYFREHGRPKEVG